MNGIIRQSAVLSFYVLLALSLVAKEGVDRFRGLIENNPFEERKPPPPPAPEPPPQFELRGVLVEGSERYFSLHDLQTKKARWFRLNDPEAPVRLLAYEPGNASLLIEAAGGRRRLALKATSSNQGGSIMGSGSQMQARLPTPAVSIAELREEKRVGQAAEHIREKREQRARRQNGPAVPRV